MAKEYKVVHKKSNVLVNGLPKLPSASTLEYGEIAVNYAQSGETLSIRNSADQVVPFPSTPIVEKMIENAVSGINKTIEDDEYVTADALNDLNNRVQYLEDYPADLSGLVSSVTYDSQTKRINFYDINGNAIGTYVDTTDFVKDGMIDTATIGTPTGGTNSGVTCIIITFNTDAGKEDIELPISQIFNANNYYTKTEAEQYFLTGYTETDPTVPAWAKAATKPTYMASEVGAMATSERGNYLTTATTIPSTAAEVGAMATSERGNYLATGTTLDNIPDGNVRQLSKYSYTSHTHTAEEVGAMATSERSNYSTTGHTHSQYATTAHTHTAAEVGAMATSERSNYATTAHTHSEYLTSADTKNVFLAISGTTTYSEITAARNSGKVVLAKAEAFEVYTYESETFNVGHVFSSVRTTSNGDIFVSRLICNQSNQWTSTRLYVPNESDIESSGFTKNALTGFTETDPTVPAWAKSENKPTYTASEVGAMATSERSNYSTTGHTHSQYATTAHTHTAAEVGAMATSERSNYSTTGHTHSQYATTSHTHTAAEVGAMATSERSNYLTTATTIPTESTIAGSGFTKNAITGINVNGTAATVTNGVAEITVQSGGSTLPSVTAADNGKVLMVVNGAWAAVMPTTVYTGTDTPLSSIGNDGDIYLQTS